VAQQRWAELEATLAAVKQLRPSFPQAEWDGSQGPSCDQAAPG